jgi:hypothetical protein
MKAHAEEMTGFFVRRYPNGVFEGDMFKGKMEGKGRFTFRGGEIYEGDWLDNKVPPPPSPHFLLPFLLILSPRGARSPLTAPIARPLFCSPGLAAVRYRLKVSDL